LGKPGLGILSRKPHTRKLHTRKLHTITLELYYRAIQRDLDAWDSPAGSAPPLPALLRCFIIALII
jgi:hypothetical protein